MEAKKVAIIGAGISGIAACKFIKSKGMVPIVFEARGNIGGIWNETLKTTELQTPRNMFSFSDFPWPKSVTQQYPLYNQVMDYLLSYAQHFELMNYIRLNTRVLSIEYQGFSDDEIQRWTHWGNSGTAFDQRSKWKLNIVDATTNLPLQEVVADFVVLCIGRHSDAPNIPEFPPNEGPEAFKAGKILHSLEYFAMDFDSATNLIKDKKVAVVGLHRAALELAMECANTNDPNKPCTLIYRREHWNPPDNRPWGIPMAYLFMNRFFELLIHKPGEGFLFFLLAILLSPIRWLISKMAETDVMMKAKLTKYGMVPKHSFLEDVSSCMFSRTPPKFYDKVDEGSIILKKSPTFSFWEKGVKINGGTELIDSDVVILATGYRGDLKLKNIFTSSTFQNYMNFGNLAVPMYRLCIHPRVPQLAVFGFSESNSNLYTSELRSRWLAEFLDGTFKLPSIKEMEKDIAEWEKCLKRYSGASYKRGCIAIFHTSYNDQLCKDIGWNPRRKKGFLADLFLPYGPSDYASP